MKRNPAVGLLMLTAAVLTGCGGDAPATDATETNAETNATVTIETFNFQPDPITVKAGDLIVFKNNDKIDHTVTAGTREEPQPEEFDGDLPEQGAEFELTLDEPGTYDYFCEIHKGPGMTGQIVIE